MKSVLAVAIIFFLEGSSAGVVSNTTVVDSDLDFLCTNAVYEDSWKCVDLDHDDQQKCLSNLVLQYFKCTIPDLADLELLEEIVPTAMATTVYGPINLDNIRCILDVILDLIKCIVDGELKPNVPFVWDWKALIECVVTNVSKVLTCIPI